jgi:hypothetical protein
VRVEFAGHDQFSWEINLPELPIGVNLATGFKLNGDASRAADALGRHIQ